MATKLKNMHLTSVDLVRSGANQEADICLFKSDAEGPDSPQEKETGLFKRFLSWLTESPVEKTAPSVEANSDLTDEEKAMYTGALLKSIQSIHGADDLTEDQKLEMVYKSAGQFMEAVEKINYLHDELGRFASAGAGVAHATVANGGSTSDLHHGGKAPKTGYSFVTKEDVARGEQVAINKYWSKDKKRAEVKKAVESFIEKNKDVLKEGGENGKHLGTWFDTKTGTLWLDVSTNFKSKSAAIKAANEAGEIAIWDAAAGQEIRLRDTHA